MKRRGSKIKQNISNRGIYFLVTLGIIIALSVGVYAITAGTTPNPGHSISEMGVPSNCGNNSALMWDGGSLVCGNNYIWTYRWFANVIGTQETTQSIKTKVIGLPGWNMDSVSQASIDYGSDISWDKIVRVSVMIVSDPDVSTKYAVDFNNGGTWKVGSDLNNKIVLTRTTGGIFDSADFNYAYSIQDHRGWVVIEYS